jgi:hypothetical protein
MGILDRLVEAVNKEYDRRIKRASNVTEYGVHHGHGHGSDQHAADEDAAVISNVPVGSRVHGGQRPNYPPPPDDHAS